MSMSNTKKFTKDWQIPEHKILELKRKQNKYAIVIPVFNEGERIKKQLHRMKSFSKVADIILSDAGSCDGTLDSKFVKRYNIRTLLINTSNNKGQSNQLKIGFSYVIKQGYKGLITLDGNGKDDVSAIPRFIKELDFGYDYVQGSRFIKGGKHVNTPIDRTLFNRLLISPILSIAAKKWYTDTPNNFRSYSRLYLLHPAVQPFRNIFERYELLFYLVTRANQLKLKTKEIPVTRSYPEGKVPTKIVGFNKMYDLLNIVKIAVGVFNP